MDTIQSRLEFRPIHPDCGDNASQRTRRAGVFYNTMGPPPERRSTISNMMPSQTHAFPLNTRMRNLSGGSSGSTSSSTGSSTSSSLNMDSQYSSDNQMFMENSNMSQNRLPGSTSSSSLSHRKLDRSLSDSDSDRLSGNASSAQNQRSVNSSRYKTELCRPFEESGSCKYGDKCQFAHGYHELRNLSRHPKYKTELCRTFHTIGFCPYGPRCHFLHESETAESSPKPARQASTRASNNFTSTSGSSSPSLSPSGSDTDYSAFTYHGDGTSRLADDTVNKNNVSSMQSMEQQFNSVLNFNRNSTNDNSNVFGGVFNSGSNKKVPRPIGSDEFDIFTEVTMFNPASVLNTVDNAPKPHSQSQPHSQSYSQTHSHSFNMQSMKLDNFQSYVDTSCWQPQNSHHSPTGSMGSDGANSECSGSTESLASSGCRDTTGSFSPFSHWISGF